jgi:hypothetical protein
MTSEEKYNGRRAKRKRIQKDPGKPVHYEAVKWGVTKEQVLLTFFDFPARNSGKQQ